MMLDGEAREVGSGGSYSHAVRKLVNTRGYRDSIAGAPGTLRLSGADIGLAIPDYAAENFTTAIQSGIIYAANGNKVPLRGTIIELLNTNDLLDSAFFNAKGSALKKYDNFEIISSYSGYEQIKYRGNIRIPGIRGFGDRPDTELVLSKAGNIVERFSGSYFTSDLLSTHILWPDGKRDKINAVLDGSHVRVDKSDDREETVGCIIQGMINASHNFKHHNTIVVLSHNRFYMSDGVPAIGWREIPVINTTLPDPSFCRFHEDGEDLILINKNGQYRIVLNGPYAYKLNIDGPSQRLTSIEKNTGLTNGYRSIYTMSRISGSVYTDDRTKAANGAVLEHETSPTPVDPVTGIDYAECWNENEISADNSLEWSEFKAPAPGITHCTHFSHYRTKNLNDAGISNGNLRNLFVWAGDYPIGKAFFAYRDSHGVITATFGKFEMADIGNTIVFQDGSTDTIVDVLSETSAQGTGDTGINLQSAGFGGGNVCTVSQSGREITVSGVALVKSLEGLQLFLADGKIEIITRIIDSTHAIVNVEFSYTNMAAVLNPTSRVINDAVPDSVLQTRIESGRSLYILQNRYFNPLPNADIGWLIPGFLFVAVSGKNRYYYCNTGRTHLIGCFHPEKMTNDKIVDGIKSIRYFNGSVIFRCTNRTDQLSTTTSNEGGDVTIGEEYPALNDPTSLDDALGVPNDNSSRFLQNGHELVWTNEPAIRIFDGFKYGENLAEGLVMSEIRKIFPNARIAYSPVDGINIWGEQAE
jgi:hypothetical protein